MKQGASEGSETLENHKQCCALKKPALPIAALSCRGNYRSVGYLCPTKIITVKGIIVGLGS